MALIRIENGGPGTPGHVSLSRGIHDDLREDRLPAGFILDEQSPYSVSLHHGIGNVCGEHKLHPRLFQHGHGDMGSDSGISHILAGPEGRNAAAAEGRMSFDKLPRNSREAPQDVGVCHEGFVEKEILKTAFSVEASAGDHTRPHVAAGIAEPVDENGFRTGPR